MMRWKDMMEDLFLVLCGSGVSVVPGLHEMISRDPSVVWCVCACVCACACARACACACLKSAAQESSLAICRQGIYSKVFRKPDGRVQPSVAYLSTWLLFLQQPRHGSKFTGGNPDSSCSGSTPPSPPPRPQTKPDKRITVLLRILASNAVKRRHNATQCDTMRASLHWVEPW